MISDGGVTPISSLISVRLWVSLFLAIGAVSTILAVLHVVGDMAGLVVSAVVFGLFVLLTTHWVDRGTQPLRSRSGPTWADTTPQPATPGLVTAVRFLALMVGGILTLSLLLRVQHVFAPGLWSTTAIYLTAVAGLVYWGASGITSDDNDYTSWATTTRMTALLLGVILGLGLLFRVIGIFVSHSWAQIPIFLFFVGLMLLVIVRRGSSGTTRPETH